MKVNSFFYITPYGKYIYYSTPVSSQARRIRIGRSVGATHGFVVKSLLSLLVLFIVACDGESLNPHQVNFKAKCIEYDKNTVAVISTREDDGVFDIGDTVLVSEHGWITPDVTLANTYVILEQLK